MNFPKFLRLIMLPRVEHVKINSTTTITKAYVEPVEVEIASLLAKKFEFSYEIVTPSDNEVGRQLPNGNWTGMAGMLLGNEGDIVVSILTITPERMEFLDYSFPLFRSPVTFITTKPEYSHDITAFLKPFNVDLWISLIVFLFVMPAIFLTVLKRRCGYGKLLLATFRSLLCQPIGISSQNMKEYFMMYFYVLGAAFLVHSYTCVLLSFITFPTSTGVRTIRELAAAVTARKYQCVSYPGSILGRVLSVSNNENFRIIGENMLQNGGSSDILDVLRSSKDNSKRAFISSLSSIIPFKAKYFISQDEFYSVFVAFSMRKDFCCRELVTRFVLDTRSTGLMEKIVERNMFRQSLGHVFGNDEESASARGVRQFLLEDVAGAFFVLGIGYSLSVAALILEMIFQRLSRHSKRSTDLCRIHRRRTRFKN